MSWNTALGTIGALLVPALAAAQGNSGQAHHREQCRFAAQIVATGQPSPHRAWALSYISVCGAEGGAALAINLRAMRFSEDTAALEALARPLFNYRDSTLFRAELEVAGDATASVPARVLAFRSLTSLLHPDRRLRYASVAGPLDARGFPTVSCGRGSYISDPPRFEGSPLPTDFAQQIHDLGGRVWRDTTVADEVRSAGYCAY